MTHRFDFLMLALLGVLLCCSPLLIPEIAASSAVATSPAPVTTPVSEPVLTIQANHIEERPSPVSRSTLPDFTAIADVRAKKQTFFNFLLPKVRESNQKIRQTRGQLLYYRDLVRTGETLPPEAAQRVADLAKRYRIRGVNDLPATVDALLIKVDVVPESLVLAQAANESGWGTSRFARKANNLFGVWCFSPGCGLKPLARDEGLKHEVASYNSIQDGVDAYIHTINTHPAYVGLRQIRAAHRSEEQIISGLALAEGLEKYSSRGVDYVREIQQLIRVNDLQKYTLVLASQSV